MGLIKQLASNKGYYGLYSFLTLNTVADYNRTYTKHNYIIMYIM